MSITIIIGIILFGLLLIMVEAFLVPGTTIVGLLGLIVVGLGIYQAFLIHGAETGGITLVVALGLTSILTYFGLKNLSKGPFAVKETIDGRVNDEVIEGIEKGDTGKALSDLRPEGKAMINNQRITVFSRGEFISNGSIVVVFNIEGNKIYVKSK